MMTGAGIARRERGLEGVQTVVTYNTSVPPLMCAPWLGMGGASRPEGFIQAKIPVASLVTFLVFEFFMRAVARGFSAGDRRGGRFLAAAFFGRAPPRTKWPRPWPGDQEWIL